MSLYNLKQIMHQALEDQKTIKSILPKGVSVIGHGVKLQKFSDKIEILNMGKGGDYFKECNDKEYQYFLDYGWKAGSIKLSMSNCVHKLGIIEERIKKELNTRKNDKHIQNLKTRRETLLNKYAQLKQKLNQINTQ
jgi:hypothetical protein